MDNYRCDECNFSTNRKHDWERHITSSKHIGKTLKAEKQKLYSCECGKQFKTNSGYSKHRKKCKSCDDEVIAKYQEELSSEKNRREELTNLVRTLIKQNEELMSMTRESQHNLEINTAAIVGHPTTIVHNHGPTNNFNINMKLILNTHCSEAMSLNDFVDQLQINSDDLDNTRKVGLADSMRAMILRSLKNLDIKKRPIHCSDYKQSKLYVKDELEWDEDKKCENVKKAIRDLSFKQVKYIKEWERENPDWNKSDAGTEQYCKMVKNIMNGMGEGDLERYKNESKIVKAIAKETMVAEDNF